MRLNDKNSFKFDKELQQIRILELKAHVSRHGKL